ncbi:hypothetical protein L2E82_25204 [Cichorium intybus]|uniref:Uncharacterized protein n=1 Tax=Cichorium intybus TaxID=13427 RepID=A0ACB9E2E1_CICIN|nr:hypothetical protein L2E82_25204 [Cichorium intybus]
MDGRRSDGDRNKTEAGRSEEMKRSRIDEEISCSIDGKIFKIGVTEFDDNYWFPFKFDPITDAKSYSEGLSEDDDEEDDGISDTWEAEVENEKEEGEFRIDDEIVNESELGRTEEDEQMTNADGIADDPRNSHDGLNGHEKQKSGSNDTSNPPNPCAGTENVEAYDENNEGKPTSSISVNLQAQIGQSNIPQPLKAGPIKELVDNGCFGPFPSPINTLDNQIEPTELGFDVGGSIGKRRKLSKCTSRISHHLSAISPTAINLENVVFPPNIDAMTDIGDNPANKFDLNRRCDSSNSVSTTSNRNSTSEEIRKTMEIGRKIGIEIAEKDPILQEVMMGEGEKEVIR